MNSSSWYPLTMLHKGASKDVMFGPSKFKNEHDSLTFRKLKPNEVVIWNPKQHKSVGLETYLSIQKSHDPKLEKQLLELGIPLDVNFN